MRWSFTEFRLARAGAPRASAPRLRPLKRRGIATIEAVLVLALLAVLWGGVRFATELSLARLQSEARARSCAWRIATQGCSDIPKDCRAKTSTDMPNSKLRALPGVEGSEEASREVGAQTDSAVDGLFLRRVSAEASIDVQRPTILGAKTVSVSGRHSLPCNTKAAPPRNLAKQLFGLLTR